MKRILWMSMCVLILLAVPAAIIGMPGGDQNTTMSAGNQTGNVTGNATANMTVFDVINQTANLSMLAAAMQVTNQTEVLNGTGPYTVFAPDNAAFGALSNQTIGLVMNNTTLASEFLQYHVVQGRYTVADLMNMTQNMTQNATQNMTQAGNATQNMTQNMTQNVTQNATQNMTLLQTLSGQNLTLTVQNGTLMIDNATIVTPDLNASNGIVQIIDKVLIPPGVNLTAPTQNQTQNMTGGGQSVTISLSAKDIAFNTSTITVPAGANVTVVFDNQDTGIPHNFAVYDTPAAQTSIFVGKIITGPATVNYTFTAPSTPGNYFFRCDVHPTIMTGTFVVTQG
jgi:uncharacterized surface protein with fasciclin (FAS1) repeats